MSKNLKQEILLFFISNIFILIQLELGGITLYLTTTKIGWRPDRHILYTNRIAFLMMVICYIISLVFLISGIKEERNKKAIEEEKNKERCDSGSVCSCSEEELL